MKHTKHTQQGHNRVTILSARLSGAIAAFLLLGALLAVPASAGFEQVATFAESGEGARFFDVSGLAVNTTGAGGVPAGTLYSVGGGGGHKGANSVARYSPKGEFREAWGWEVSVGGKKEFERCGPDGEAAHPVCKAEVGGTEGEGVGQLYNPTAVAVDQATGYVYVSNSAFPGIREHNLVQIFSADGSKLIASFGDHRASGETIEETPEKMYGEGGLAVDDSGTLYVNDFRRAMVWKPQSPGDYEHYVYTGRANDIAGKATFKDPSVGQHLALDDSGNLYSATGDFINMFAPGEPDVPLCENEIADNGLLSMTVNPVSGEVFYWDEKHPKNIYQLSACDGPGEFDEKGIITLPSKPEGLRALAFNPAFAWEASRPPGILYGAEPGNPTETRGYILARAEIHFPAVESESVSSATATTATLGAQIDPKGSDTRYAFQYLTKAAYEANPPGERYAGATEAPLGGTPLGAAQEALSAVASLVGLSPDTEYHYRAIATSHCEPDEEENLCETTGKDEAFRTFPAEAPGLPDSRAWELVSPPQKDGGEVFPLETDQGGIGGRCDQAEEGGCKPGVGTGRFPKQSAPDGEAVVYQGFPFSFTEGAAKLNEYISHRTPSGWQTTILAPALMGFEDAAYTAFNAELTQGILYQTTPSLTPDAPSEYQNLYTQPTANPASLTPLLGFEPPNRLPGFESPNALLFKYASASDDFTHQFFEANDALTGETPFAPEAVDGGAIKNNLYESVGGQLRLVNVLPGNTETAPGATFGYRGKEGVAPMDLPHAISADGSRAYWSDSAGQLYVRIDGGSTVEIPDPGEFLTASEDGSKVLLNDGHLYDLNAETTTDLTEGQGGFEGIAGQSEDLSHIYFVDTAVLTGEEENGQGAKAQAGKDNLYAWSKEGESSFVATLDPKDEGDISGDWFALPPRRTAEASPNGNWLAFQSVAPLTGYDSVGPTCARAAGKYISEPCVEAFLYDSASGQLRCVSCNPSGAHPLGPTRLPVSSFDSATASYLPLSRYLLDSGRLYFDTGDSLTPSDTNRADTAGVEDVYEYEPEGVGSCKRQAGCVSLISAGHESTDSNFLAIDETGENIFFTTRDQLVLKDRDDLMDLYVAREGGGIGSETEISRGECQGEACQAAIVPPNDPTPGSSSFEGAGNVVEQKAAKKHHRKKKHAGKAHRNHAHKRAANHNRGGAK